MTDEIPIPALKEKKEYRYILHYICIGIPLDREREIEREKQRY